MSANPAGKCWQAVLMLLLLGLCMAASASAPEAVASGAQCGQRQPGDTRPRVGLALGGGGARGVAHLGILSRIEALDIRVDCVAGTSMGALVGGLYASGMSAAELRHLVESTDWKALFNDTLARQERSFRRKQDDRDALTTVGVGISRTGLRVSPGMLQGERILALLERSTLGVAAVDDFDELPIPFRAVATDLNSGDAVVIGQGSLAMAMRASMSLPGVFQPAEIDGRVLLDGGLVNQVPVDVVRAMGADIVIAVDVGTPLEVLDRDASLVEVVSQISGMMTTGNTRRQLQTLTARDVLIVPELADTVSTSDFEKVTQALAIGDAAALKATAALSRLPRRTDQDRALALASAMEPNPVIGFVRVDNETRYADAVLIEQMAIPIGEPLDAAAVEEGLLRMYSRGTLASITYEVVRENGSTGVLVRARPKPQGPNYLQLGLVHSSDFNGAHETTLRGAILFSPVSAYGAEARIAAALGSEPALSGEYFHPFDAANRYIFYTKLGYDNPGIPLFDDRGNQYATYDVGRVGLQLQLGREFGNYAAVVAGTRFAKGKADVEIGDPALPDLRFQQGSVYARATVDRLDSLYFASEGYFASAGYSASRRWLGSDSDFDQLDVDAEVARSFGRHALQLGGRFHVTTSGQAPIQDRYRLGGRTRLAGFRVNELTGQHYAVAFVGYGYRVTEILGRAAFIGCTLEYGNAWERRSDMRWDDGILNASLYAGFDSWLGPLTFGYGWREAGEGTLFLEIGKPF